MLSRLLTWGALCLALLLTGLTAPSYAAAGDEGLPLPKPLSGQAAINALGDDVGIAARLNRMSAEELTRILSTDDSAHLDTSGRMFYADPVTERPAVDVAPKAAPYPYAQTFELHSLPGANRVVFLDFDGHTVSGTSWNDDPGINLEERFYAGLDADSLPGFSNEEKDIVQEVWQRVAEDYAPLAIDVTTEDPGAAALEQSDETDPTFGMRALVTSDSAATNVLCGGVCQGIAYMGVFDWPYSTGDFQPAWAFTSSAGNSPSFLADIISHEVGHTLGLDHDGVAGGAGYYAGQGIWLPIMGAGFRPLSQFSIGDYGVANNNQDDFAVMNGYDAPMRIDDHGQTQATATAMDSFGPRPGIISARPDVDWFSFSQPCTGSLAVNVEPAPTGPNLDVKLYVTNPAGSTIAQVDPASGTHPDTGAVIGLDASYANASLPAGTYRFAVDGVGQGDPAVAGYSDYGSRGAYTIDVDTGCATTPLAPTVPQLAAVQSADNGLSATLSWSSPSSDGGSPVTGYTVQRGTGTMVPLAATATSHTFTGLTAGTGYTFKVFATNTVGNSPTASVAATTVGPASAPQGLYANSFSAGSADLHWSAPASEGGRAITGYVVARNGAPPVNLPSTATSHTFTSLAPSTPYTLSVRAVTAFGQGTEATFAYTPPGPPSAPLNVSAVATSSTSIQIDWGLPANNGGYPITGWTVATTGHSQFLPANSALTWSFNGLTPNTTYPVTVTASNSAGQGAAGTASVHTPVSTSAPSAVQSLTLVDATPTSATVSWAPPANLGGLPLLRYEARLGTGTWVQLPRTPRQWTFSRLAGNTHYSISVRAVNDDGAGPDSSLPVLTDPPVKPTAPRIGTAVSGVVGGPVSAKAVWLAPLSDGGRAITAYRVTALKMSSTGTVLRRITKTVGPTARKLVMGLPKGRFKFQVVAINAVGTSALSARSNLVTAR